MPFKARESGNYASPCICTCLSSIVSEITIFIGQNRFFLSLSYPPKSCLRPSKGSFPTPGTYGMKVGWSLS